MVAPEPQDFAFHRSVVEVRFPKAHRYWDISGQTIEAIENALPGLICQELKPDGFTFDGDGVGASDALFYWDKVVVTQEEHDSASKFGTTAEEFWRLVARNLGVKKPGRVGHRMWFIMPTSDREHAVAYAREQSPWMLTAGAESWGTPNSDGIALRTDLAKVGRAVRIEIGAAEMKAPGAKRRHVVIFDVDITAADPEVAADDLAGFVRWNLRFVEQNKASLLGLK